jgi:small-conductance mechanosensitive channel/flagellar biosynthesis chaperone FliJ
VSDYSTEVDYDSGFMRADRSQHLPLRALLLAAGLALGAAPAFPQATDARHSEEASAAGLATAEGETSVADREADEPSDAERLLRMQQVLTADGAKLERLRTDLESRQTFLDMLTGRMAEFQGARDEMQARLEALEPTSEEAATLRDDIARLEHEYERFNRHATLTFEAESLLRRQIQDLEKKVLTDRRALAEFRFQSTGAEEPADDASTPSPAPRASPSAAPASILVPGVPLPAPTGRPEAEEAAILPRSPEQIEARQKLARTREAARSAEAAVVTFVERKEALEVQIDLEENLQQVDVEALKNLEGYLAERRQELDELSISGPAEAELAERRAQLDRLSAEIARVQGEVARRRVELDSMRERLTYATGELDRVTAHAEEKRDEAEAARQWLVWLESPLYPGNLTRWAVERGPRVLAVLLLAGLLLLALRFSLRRIARAVVTKSRKARTSAVNRADTLALSFQSLATTLILAACFLLVLQEAGLDVKTVLGGAAILGVAIAFGAQNLMRDYFTGFMMLLEDQYELGDLVTIGSITGTVERVNMRVTMLRDLEGRVHFVPNGEIHSLTNRTYDWARALVEVPIGPEQDVDRAMSVMLDVARDLKVDPEWAEEIVDEPQMLGVDKFTESGVIIKLLLKTQPERMFPIRRELLRRIKKAFDEAGVQPGFPVRVVRGQPPTGD